MKMKRTNETNPRSETIAVSKKFAFDRIQQRNSWNVTTDSDAHAVRRKPYWTNLRKAHTHANIRKSRSFDSEWQNWQTEPRRVTMVLKVLSARFHTVTWPLSDPITARVPFAVNEQAVNCKAFIMKKRRRRRVHHGYCSTNNSNVIDESFLHALAWHNVPHTDSFVQARCSHAVLVLKEATVVNLFQTKQMRNNRHIIETKIAECKQHLHEGKHECKCCS